MKISEFLNEEIPRYLTTKKKVLILMRGVPGSGKSTIARRLVKDGIIHSTDDLIEKEGNYIEFFNRMQQRGSFGPLGAKHKQNIENAGNSMRNGISPVIIDNTNLTRKQMLPYIKPALAMGYKVKYKNVGTGGKSAKELTRRNTHGVPLGAIEDMIKTYKARNSKGFPR